MNEFSIFDFRFSIWDLKKSLASFRQKTIARPARKVSFLARQAGLGVFSAGLVGFVLIAAEKGVAPMAMKIVECLGERGGGAAFGGDEELA